ncbi:MAG: tRNA uridine-5-carboxymethylaminomethyl(34) synthesis GTPase MnmE [Clostridiales bacterium]|nr:tRNA uridine-5-carboxymethylaminomethyl(34) synthesis GTPase MnmE [Clostridiales bacterium]
MKSENIAAVSTAMGASGVAVIRISGDSPLTVAEKMFKPLKNIKVSDFEPYYMYVGEILTEKFTDFGMCVYFKGPKSYTGEDMVEFHCHGGIAIVKGILEETLSNGCRLATNGEFTKRAFINGKMSLSSAEGLIGMINSESVSEVKAGYYLYRENLKKKIELEQDKLTFVLAEINADMDFPEEDLESLALENTEKTLKEVKESIEKLLETYKTGAKYKNGVSVAIVGKPNVGKSSLLNAILGYDKAIVSGIAGTTRDVVEGTTEINGVKFNFFDTAGIRESSDEIEGKGIILAEKIINSSDIVLFVKDGTIDDDEVVAISEKIKDKKVLTVYNKADLHKYNDDLFTISAKDSKNIKELKELLVKEVFEKEIDFNGDFLTEERHLISLKNAIYEIENALNNLYDLPLDLIAIDIKEAWDLLGEISGRTVKEEIINEIFSKFCVGK